jgi:hypothetical protein
MDSVWTPRCCYFHPHVLSGVPSTQRLGNLTWLCSIPCCAWSSGRVDVRLPPRKIWETQYKWRFRSLENPGDYPGEDVYIHRCGKPVICRLFSERDSMVVPHLLYFYTSVIMFWMIWWIPGQAPKRRCLCCLFIPLVHLQLMLIQSCHCFLIGISSIPLVSGPLKHKALTPIRNLHVRCFNSGPHPYGYQIPVAYHDCPLKVP